MWINEEKQKLVNGKFCLFVYSSLSDLALLYNLISPHFYAPATLVF